MRVQDGLKRYWLCNSCEMLLGSSETAFATNLFHPYQTKSGDLFKYDRWLMHFCISVSWRVMLYFLDEIPREKWESATLGKAQEATNVWREFLLQERPHPADFQQHLLPLDRIESATFELPTNINRYLTRAIDIDFCQSETRSFVYSKIGRFIIIGFINEPNPKHWQGTKINVSGGLIEPKKYVLPFAFRDYLNSQANRAAHQLASISTTQKMKIEDAFQNNLDRYIGTDAFAAMEADIELFGNKAFYEQTKRGASEP